MSVRVVWDGKRIMNNEQVKIWKEVVVTNFEVISRHPPGETHENKENPQSRLAVTRLRFEG
jgi:hypothetical protein